MCHQPLNVNVSNYLRAYLACAYFQIEATIFKIDTLLQWEHLEQTIYLALLFASKILLVNFKARILILVKTASVLVFSPFLLRNTKLLIQLPEINYHISMHKHGHKA